MASVCISFFIIKVVYFKNKVYHKMQREKLYNLDTKVYFNCILFVLKKTEFCASNFRHCENDLTEFGGVLNTKSTQIK